MTPAELHTLKARLGLSWAQLAKECGVTLRAVQGWAAGEYKPSGSACKLLELLKERKP